MGFNEKVHAFIAAKYYVHLTETFGEKGKKAFIHATQYYAEQRGRRMAQRAIRDGYDLTYETFLQYGEWVNTQEIIDAECSNKSEVKAISPDYVINIHRCPWQTQFKEMGLLEAGHEYCEHLDNSICRGFNPYLTYKVEQTLHKDDYCIHRISNTEFTEIPKKPKKPEYLQRFDYHCGHSYWSYNEVVGAIFAGKGEEINNQVLKEFAEEYGQEMADKLASYKHTNFNVTNC